MERVSLLSAGGAVPRHHGVCGGLPVQGVPACGQLRGPGGDSAGGDVDCYVQDITLHYITLHYITPGDPDSAQAGHLHHGPGQGPALQGRVRGGEGAARQAEEWSCRQECL